MGVEGPVEPLGPGEPLSLVRALLLANQDNEGLAVRGEDYVQALVNKKRAVAGFLPTIAFEPSYTVVDNADAPPREDEGGSGRAVGTIGGFKVVGDTLRRFEAPVTGTINLFNGFRDKAALEAAVSRIEERRLLLLDAQAVLLLDTARAYYDVLRLERLTNVISRQLELQQERVRDARAKVRAEVGKPLDVAQAEAQAAGTRVLLTQAESDARNARTLLAYLIGAREVSGRLADDFAVPAEVGEIEALVERAMRGREDLRAARFAIEAAEADVRNAIGQYYPSVTLDVTGFLRRENFDEASKWNAALAVNLPIFSAGLIEADVRDAWSRLRVAALNESLLRRQIEQDVRFRFEQWRTSNVKVREIGAQITAAAEAYRQATVGVGAGTAIPLEVLTAQDVLLRAELDQASEEFNRKVIYLDLLRTTGSLTLATAQRAGAATRPATMPSPAASSSGGGRLDLGGRLEAEHLADFGDARLEKVGRAFDEPVFFSGGVDQHADGHLLSAHGGDDHVADFFARPAALVEPEGGVSEQRELAGVDIDLDLSVGVLPQNQDKQGEHQEESTEQYEAKQVNARLPSPGVVEADQGEGGTEQEAGTSEHDLPRDQSGGVDDEGRTTGRRVWKDEHALRAVPPRVGLAVVGQDGGLARIGHTILKGL
jgi:outer membrane protein TolC